MEIGSYPSFLPHFLFIFSKDVTLLLFFYVIVLWGPHICGLGQGTSTRTWIFFNCVTSFEQSAW